MSKKDRKDYQYYNLSVPIQLRMLFEAYLKSTPTLGHKNVSQYMLKLLQDRAEEILNENPKLKIIEEIELKSGTYVLQKDGRYKLSKKKELKDS